MSLKKTYPILEFDSAKEAYINPEAVVGEVKLPEHFVVTFFKEALTHLFEEGRLDKLGTFRSETVDIPLYKTRVDDRDVGVCLGYVGAAASAALLEELIASGAKKFLVCGGAGVLTDSPLGTLFLPSAAVRDEGASYHYLPPSREAVCDPLALTALKKAFDHHGIPYREGKTWTTDGVYRETREKTDLRRAEGCLTVEMEAAAFFAVSRFRGVRLAQILYGGDDLSKTEWDKRGWNHRSDIRKNLLELTLQSILWL